MSGREAEAKVLAKEFIDWMLAFGSRPVSPAEVIEAVGINESAILLRRAK